MWWNAGWGEWFAMVTMMVLFWGGLIAVVLLIVRGRASDQAERTGPRGPSAREILDERFAKGEIDRDEYEERRAVLDRRDR